MEGRRLATTLATIYTAKLGMNTATRFVYPFLPAIARGLGVSLEAVSLLIAVRWLAGLATPVVVRLLAPGEQRRRLALIGLALGSAGAAITTFGLFGLAVAGFILMGIGEPVADVAFQAFLGDEVPYERRARAISLVELAWGSALLVGAPVAGWLLSVWGWQTPFGVIAIALALLIWPVSRQLGAGHDPTHHRSVSRGRLRLDRSMVAFLGAAAAFTFAAEISFVVFGAWLEEAFDASLVALGSTAIFIAIGELLGEGASIGFTDRIGKRRAVVVGLAISTVGYLAVSAANTYLLGVLAFSMALARFRGCHSVSHPACHRALPARAGQVSRPDGHGHGRLARRRDGCRRPHIHLGRPEYEHGNRGDSKRSGHRTVGVLGPRAVAI